MIEIRELQLRQTTEVKRLILDVCQEVFQVPEAVVLEHDSLSDLDQVRQIYSTPEGIFLVTLDNKKVIGCGAIRQISQGICELKRLFFRSKYRGQGVGKYMANHLLILNPIRLGPK